MKNFRFLTFVLTIATVLLSACGAAATTATPAPLTTSASSKVDAMPVAFVGVVDSMAGDQWVISGTTVTVNESIVRDGPFHVGDRIKVEGLVNPDGSFTVSRVETPTPQDVLTATPVVADNSNEALSNSNTNDANVNDDNSNGLNSNDDNSNASNSNDDNGGNSNSSVNNSNTSNSNDDNGGGNSNSSVDNSNTSNSNDDNGGGNSNSSVDNSNTSNSNDDNGGSNSNNNSGGGNSNDDNGGGGGGGNSNDDNGNGG